jgi:1,4-dihydroxy-2-naphthoate octaprenyltransferase
MSSSDLTDASLVRPGSLQAWAAAVRLPSLLVAISPVAVGTALAWQRTGQFELLIALLALAAAVALQVISNLQNDVGYTARGAELAGNRTGLPRATANGWLSVGQVRTAIVLCCALAIAIGLPVVAARGWPVLAIGLASIIAALAYMGGPRPIAYTPFGEFVVFVFFGLVAVAGSDFIQTGDIGVTTWLAAIALGALAAAALAVNNHRDIDHDRSVGRRTFPVVFGAQTAKHMYTASLYGAFALVLPMAWREGAATLLAPLLLLPTALRLNRDFLGCPPGLAYNAILVRTFKLELGYAALISAGAVAARLLP